MNATDIRDLQNHVSHFGLYAVVRKLGAKWIVDFRGHGCPTLFKTRDEAAEWVQDWTDALRKRAA
jgi:hypothetical protein